MLKEDKNLEEILANGILKSRTAAERNLTHEEVRHLALNCLVREYDDFAEFKTAREVKENTVGQTVTMDMDKDKWHGGSEIVPIQTT